VCVFDQERLSLRKGPPTSREGGGGRGGGGGGGRENQASAPPQVRALAEVNPPASKPRCRRATHLLDCVVAKGVLPRRFPCTSENGPRVVHRLEPLALLIDQRHQADWLFAGLSALPRDPGVVDQECAVSTCRLAPDAPLCLTAFSLDCCSSTEPRVARRAGLHRAVSPRVDARYVYVNTLCMFCVCGSAPIETVLERGIQDPHGSQQFLPPDVWSFSRALW
jgi:hypothetical protein